MVRAMPTVVPSNRRLVLRPSHALFSSLWPPRALSFSHSTLYSVPLPALSGVLLLNQDPRANLAPPEPLTSYSPPCTKSNPPLFNLRKLPWCMACVAPGGGRSGFKTARP